MVHINLLKLHILLWDLIVVVHVCVCWFICMHAHVQQSLHSTVFFHTMTAHSNPIKATQRALQRHSFICHLFSPAVSPSLLLSSFSLLVVNDMGGNRVGEL